MNKIIKSRTINILFISSQNNYFNDNNSSFPRMYENLKFFKQHKNFNVFVLQSTLERKFEKERLKGEIITYYYKGVKFLRNKFIIFLDFNPFYINKALMIIKKHNIDLIHIDYVFGINIINLLTKIPISYNAFNVEYVFADQVGKFYFKIPKIFRNLYLTYIYLLEKLALKSVKNVNAISFYDKEKFSEIYKISKEKIIVNFTGYISEIYNNPVDKAVARSKLNVEQDKFILIYHGSYLSKSDSEAVNIIRTKIAPSIKDREILILIAGKDFPEFEDSENLKFLGYVEDIRYFLYSADIAIVPIFRGSGIRIKILDYLSACIPVISTRKGAEGHLLQNGIHGCIIDKSIDDLIEKIYFLKNNPKIISVFKNNINKLLKEKYNWKKNSKIIEKRYKEIVKE